MNVEKASEIEADNDAESDGVAFLPFFPLLQVWCSQFSWRGKKKPCELNAVDVRQLLRCSRQILGYFPPPLGKSAGCRDAGEEGPVSVISVGLWRRWVRQTQQRRRGDRPTQAIQWRFRERRQTTGKWKQSVHFGQNYKCTLSYFKKGKYSVLTTEIQR